MAFQSPPKPLSKAYDVWPERGKELAALLSKASGLRFEDAKITHRSSVGYYLKVVGDKREVALFAICPSQSTARGNYKGLLRIEVFGHFRGFYETSKEGLDVQAIADAIVKKRADNIAYMAEEATRKRDRFRSTLAEARKERAHDRAREKKGPVRFRLYDTAGRNIFVAYWGRNVRDAVEEFINGIGMGDFILKGLSAPRVNLGGIGIMPDLPGARLDGSILSDNELLDLSRASCRNCVFDRSFFGKDFDGRYGDFSGASFRDAVLDRCDFSYANLRGCDFRGATVENVDFYNADLTGAVGLTGLARNGRRARSIQ